MPADILQLDCGCCGEQFECDAEEEAQIPRMRLNIVLVVLKVLWCHKQQFLDGRLESTDQ